MKKFTHIKPFCLILALLLGFGYFSLPAQSIPGQEENISYLVTFGKEAPGEWGDDDHCSVFFITLPPNHRAPIYLRVFDPDNGGAIDENKGNFNSKTRFSIYGGPGAYSHPDARGTDPVGKYLSGTLLQSKTFGMEEKYDENWYSFGPFNPAEGERTMVAGEDKLVFKIVSEGVAGDDGNLYRYFLSTKPSTNISVEGAETFTFEYNFRMEPGLSHIYPFIGPSVVRIRQHNYDFDGDGYLRLVSVVKKSELATMSVDGEWRSSTHEIMPEERNMCIDFQVVSLVNRRNNNVAFIMYNQFGEALPFLNVPIGVERIENRIKVKQK